MRYLLLLAACLVAGPLTAETIGNVEYHLPNQGKGWKIVNEMKSTKNKISTTVVYVPEKSSRLKNKEFFGVHVNNIASDINDEVALESGVQVQYPENEISMTILEMTPESVLYEWSVRNDEEEIVHGWTRIFSTRGETTVLMYQTKQIDNVKKVGPIWVETLRKAKLFE